MKTIEIIQGHFAQSLKLQLTPELRAGFPSPAEEYIHDSLDFNREPHHGSIVVAYINNEFTIKYLDLSHREEGYIELRPANPLYQPIRILPDDDFEVWGVVIFTIKNHDK